MVLIDIECPYCYKKGTLDIDEYVVRYRGRGITGVSISEDTICNHSFVAYIDPNFIARDSIMVDFSVKLPDIKPKVIKCSLNVEDYADINGYLISLHLHAYTLAYLFRGIFLKQKIVLINDKKNVNNHLSRLLEYCFKSNFDYDLTILNDKEYNKNKKKYTNYLVLSKDKVINDKSKVLTSKKMKIENIIIQKFLDVQDVISGLIVLKNEILKAHQIAMDAVSNFYKLPEEIQKKYSIFNLTEYINKNASKHFKIHLHKAYLDFIIDIILYYFELDISHSPEEDFLRYL